VLRWIYAKGGERLYCELSLDRDSAVYELRLDHLKAGRGSRVEQFGHVMPAFLRHADLESRLIADGWSLEYYEKRSPTLN
jgi:hypothetical protein